MALSEKSILLRVTIYNAIEKIGGRGTTSDIRKYFSMASCQKLSQILSDSTPPKGKLIDKRRDKNGSIVWILNEKTVEFIKLYSEKILSNDDFEKLTNGKSIKSKSNNNESEIKQHELIEQVTNQPQINENEIQKIQNTLCSSANISIEGIVRMSESIQQYLNFLTGMRLEIDNFLDTVNQHEQIKGIEINGKLSES